MPGDDLGVDRADDGTARASSAKGRVISPKRAAFGSCGVRPPCPNQALPRIAVSPEASTLTATPETIWLPRCVIAAKPWTSAKTQEAATAAKRPAQGFGASAATAPAAKAPTSILPSSPISTTPARSENRPARQAKISGTESRMAESVASRMIWKASPISRAPPNRHRPPAASTAR